MCAFVGGQGHGVREDLPRGKKPVVSAQAEVAGVDGHVCAQSPAMCMCVCVLPGMCPKRYLRPEGLMRSRSNRASFCERVGKQALIVAEILLQEQCFTMWNYDRGRSAPAAHSAVAPSSSASTAPSVSSPQHSDPNVFSWAHRTSPSRARVRAKTSLEEALWVPCPRSERLGGHGVSWVGIGAIGCMGGHGWA